MKGARQYWRKIMRQMALRKFAIAISTVAFAALFTVGWSEQRGISVSVESAQARRLYVSPHYYYNHYRADLSGVSWDAVRAYYAGGPWCGIGSAAGYGTVGYSTVGYGAAGGLNNWTCYSGWDDYAHRNGIGCTPGSLVKGGDGIDYVCQ
jgi:hypothetical protein